ncbi:hypothetical protein RO3G_16094 [Lichtheimia corymbifera JMRC:FSU:9682]|uniref:DAGKc domain-containing protein n=1 Tax=Lichtheimia corymbifera JMRC:FSU:9682 TaxID=1263082 RepID=A0A068S8P9_9FUNG|nr:hypothetical protein RO3G_16094 [Lichtheimia corymbifera JMRC:FSU:9682]
MSLTTLATDIQNDVKVTLTVNDHHLLISNDNGSNETTTTTSLELDLIYGVKETKDKQLEISIIECEQGQNENGSQQSTSITNFRDIGKTTWKQRTLVFDKLSAPEFATRLRQRVLPDVQPNQRVVAIINPAAGSRQALSQWNDTVKPMLVAAGYDTDTMSVTETKPNEQTRILVEQLGVKMISENANTTFIILGGDGTVHEVVNGLSDAYDRRVNWPSLPTFKLGIIPSGSGNALSLSLQLQSIEHATLRIIKQNTQPLRLVDVQLPIEQKRKLRIMVVMSWGFHAQLVSKARYLKPFVDNRRFSWVAMWLLYFLQHYAGELTMSQVQRYNKETKKFDDIQEEIVIKDEKFTYFAVTKQASLERGFTITPFASPATEDMDIILMRDASKEQLQSATIKAIQGGKHVDEEEYVEYYKAKELALEVRDATDICLDGEIASIPANSIVRLKVVGPSQGEPDFQTFV